MLILAVFSVVTNKLYIVLYLTLKWNFIIIYAFYLVDFSNFIHHNILMQIFKFKWFSHFTSKSFNQFYSHSSTFSLLAMNVFLFQGNWSMSILPSLVTLCTSSARFLIYSHLCKRALVWTINIWVLVLFLTRSCDQYQLYSAYD